TLKNSRHRSSGRIRTYDQSGNSRPLYHCATLDHPIEQPRQAIFAHDSHEATANQLIASRQAHTTPQLRHLSTLKALFSVMLAFAVCVGSAQAGPVRTARHVAKDTAITAKNVAHSTVKGTRRAVHTVISIFTP